MLHEGENDPFEGTVETTGVRSVIGLLLDISASFVIMFSFSNAVQREK